MGTIIGNVATFAGGLRRYPYFGVLFSTQRSSTHRELQRLAAILALPIFTTLNTPTVVTRPTWCRPRRSVSSGSGLQRSVDAGSPSEADDGSSRESSGSTRSRPSFSASPLSFETSCTSCHELLSMARHCFAHDHDLTGVPTVLFRFDIGSAPNPLPAKEMRERRRILPANPRFGRDSANVLGQYVRQGECGKPLPAYFLR